MGLQEQICRISDGLFHFLGMDDNPIFYFHIQRTSVSYIEFTQEVWVWITKSSLIKSNNALLA